MRKMILTAWSRSHEAVKINASKRCTPLLQDVMAHTSVTSHCFWLTSRHAACSTRPVRKVTRGQAMSGHIITIIAVQQFLKNGNTCCRLLIQLPLNKLCLVMPNQVSRHYHVWTHNSLNDNWIFPRVLLSSSFVLFLSLSFFLYSTPPIYIRLLTDAFIYPR
jgi:hypothetical protein